MDAIKKITPSPSTIVGTFAIAAVAAVAVVWASNNVQAVKKHIG
ncbi:hypothetical protein [Catenovulum agarivorans]|nr:hypothetical protein [Catenovulum agarivorans]